MDLLFCSKGFTQCNVGFCYNKNNKDDALKLRTS